MIFCSSKNRGLAIVGGIFVTLVWLVAPLAGEEPVTKFVEALRDSHYHDTALDYLDSLLDGSRGAPNDRAGLLYERARTLLDGAPSQRDYVLREKQLVEAGRVFVDFAAGQPQHPLVMSARLHAGRVTMALARLRLELAERASEPNRQALRNEALRLYSQARDQFEGEYAELLRRLEQIPKALVGKKGARLIELRDQYRLDFLQTQLLIAATFEESSEALDKSTNDYQRALRRAHDEYLGVYEKYRQRIEGKYARLCQGRTLQKRGLFEKALECYETLLELDEDSPMTRDLQTRTLLLAIECWSGASPPRYDQIVRHGNAWLETLDRTMPRASRTDESMNLRLSVARAAKSYGEQRYATNPHDPRIAALRADARRLAQEVVDFAPLRKYEGRLFLAELDSTVPREPAPAKDLATDECAPQATRKFGRWMRRMAGRSSNGVRGRPLWAAGR